MNGCETCGGSGHVCCDDICVGSGECMHGDAVCPECYGDPDYGWDDNDDLYPACEDA
jgi:hypothetical protein